MPVTQPDRLNGADRIVLPSATSLLMCRKSLLLVLGLWLFGSLNIQSFGQSITAGDVAGTVTDASGGAVPNASVTLTNVNTNVAQKGTTNAEGSFRFAFIPPGTYQIDVMANGFQPQQRTGKCQRGATCDGERPIGRRQYVNDGERGGRRLPDRYR